LAKDILK